MKVPLVAVFTLCMFFNTVSMEHGFEMETKPRQFHWAAAVELDTQETNIRQHSPCHKNQNNNQNWFDPGLDEKKMHTFYKDAVLSLEEKIITRYGYGVDSYTLEGPNPLGTSITTISSQGKFSILTTDKNNKKLKQSLCYRGSLSAVALSSDNILAINGPSPESGYFFELYQVGSEHYKGFFGGMKERPALTSLGSSTVTGLGLLFKRMMFAHPELLYCVDLKNKLRAVRYDSEQKLITANKNVPLPRGKNQRVKCFALDSMRENNAVLVDNLDDIYFIVTHNSHLNQWQFKKLKTLTALLELVKDKVPVHDLRLKYVKLKNAVCFFGFAVPKGKELLLSFKLIDTHPA